MCRSGCPSPGTHKTYGECLRAASVRVAYCDSANGQDATKQRRWDKELEAYRSAKASGIQPKGTTQYHIDNANRLSDLTGTAFTG